MYMADESLHFQGECAIVTTVEIFRPDGLCEVYMKLLQWCKANAIPVIAVLAAAVTAVFVPPDAAYLGYYDVKTLSCLLCVLAVAMVLRGIPYWLGLLVIVMALLVLDRRALLGVDWGCW